VRGGHCSSRREGHRAPVPREAYGRSFSARWALP
jgi:hypothetical protein